MQDIPFSTPGQALAQAIPQAAQTVSQGIQLGMQAREQRWQQQYQKAAIAVNLISNDNVPDSIKLRAANNGLLPMLSDGQFKVLGESHAQVKPFTEDDLKDKEFIATAQKLKSISEDKELNPTQKRQFQRQTMIDYYTTKGKAAEALKLQENLLDEEETHKNKVFDQAGKLREELTKRTERFRQVSEATKNVHSVATAGTGPGDIALIYNFMTVFQPTSVVRESEFKSAADAKAWLSRVDMGVYGNVVIPTAIREAIQKADPKKSGPILLPEQRKEFVKTVDQTYAGQKEIFDQTANEFEKMGKIWEIPREMIVPEVPDPRVSANNPQSLMPKTSAPPKKRPTNADDWLKGLGQ